MPRHSQTLSLSVIALWPLILAGCQRSSAAAGVEKAPGASSSAASATPPIGDAAIRDALLAELKQDRHLDAGALTVKVTNGVVDLTGKVDNPLSRQRALRVAEAVRGVRSVSDHMDVSPPKRADSEIEQDMKNALRFAAATAHLPLHVSVKNQVATLTGNVSSWQEQKLVERVADSVRGVRLTQDDLSIKRDKREAIYVDGEIKSRLAWDLLLERDPVTVTIKDQRVTLSGKVGSAAERTRAIEDAWVPGVADVDAIGLLVEVPRPDDNGPAGAAKTGPEVAAAVRAAKAFDPRVKAADVSVSVNNGVVTLTGTVENVKARQVAEFVTRNVVGVLDVKNQLGILSAEHVSDTTLGNQLRSVLMSDALTDGKDVHVAVKDARQRSPE